MTLLNKKKTDLIKAEELSREILAGKLVYSGPTSQQGRWSKMLSEAVDGVK